MPNINVEISESLLQAIRIRCAREMVMQKDLVPRILGEALNGDMQAAGGGVRHEAPVQERSVPKVRSRPKGNAPSPRKPEEQAARTEEVSASKGGKKLTAEQFLTLSNSEQMRAKREERF